MSGCRQLDSRLVVPPLPPRHIWRPRLITALDSADVPLVLLAAGPGAGKTVLLSEWALRHDGPAWWTPILHVYMRAASDLPLSRSSGVIGARAKSRNAIEGGSS